VRTYGKLHRKGEKSYKPRERDFRRDELKKRVKRRKVKIREYAEDTNFNDFKE
jgi:hypothetical protein